MPSEVYDELLTRMGPRITKQNTTYREALDPGLKLAFTLRHLDSGTNITQCPLGGGCLATPYPCSSQRCTYIHTCTPEEWRDISNNYVERWNFSHTCGVVDGKHVNCKCPPNSGSLYYNLNYKGFYVLRCPQGAR